MPKIRETEVHLGIPIKPYTKEDIELFLRKLTRSGYPPKDGDFGSEKRLRVTETGNVLQATLTPFESLATAGTDYYRLRTIGNPLLNVEYKSRRKPRALQQPISLYLANDHPTKLLDIKCLIEVPTLGIRLRDIPSETDSLDAYYRLLNDMVFPSNPEVLSDIKFTFTRG